MIGQAVSKAPLRISFAGGGTDVEPFSSTFGGLVVSAAIDRYQWAILRLRDDNEVHLSARTAEGKTFAPPPAWLELAGAMGKRLWSATRGFDLEMISSIQRRSGLGGSGAMCLAVAGAMNEFAERPLGRQELAELSYHVEGEVLGNDCGWQDHFAAAFGGMHCYEAAPAVRATPLAMGETSLRRLEQGLVLLWLGQRKEDSGRIIRRQSRRMKAGGTALQAALASKSRVRDMATAISQTDFAAIGQLLDELWRQKKCLCDRISNDRIDGMHAALTRSGMIGGKVTGAGGGGHFLACCEPGARGQLLAACREMGLKSVPFHLGAAGLSVQRLEIGQCISDSNVAAG